MQHLQPGTTLQGGKYRIESVIGQGGFGNTYVANSSTMGSVAIKEFFWKGVCERDDATGGVSVSDIAHYGNFRQQKEKFKTEARRLQQFNTPHIVKVYDLSEENGTAYYVMDYIDGQNLSDRMRRLDRALTEDEVREMLPQILEALRCVHAAGLWHLDLKPSNIMVDRQGGVRLIDFGASKQLDAQTGGATAKTRQTYTNGYAPREQMDENFSLYGAWTDIYSLGATLYCLLTKRRPPMPSDIDDDHSADKHEALPFPATVSEQMRSLVRRMMNTSRQKRPQNVDEVMGLLGISAGNAYGGGTQSQYDEATAFASHGGGDETQFAGQTSQEQTRYTNGASNESTVYSQQGGSSGSYSSNAYNNNSSSYYSNQSSSSSSNGFAFLVPFILVLAGVFFYVWNENRVKVGKKDVYKALGHGVYDGELRKGEPHGQGTITYDSGVTFTGEFKNGEPYGHGVLKSEEGKVLFDGEYENNIRTKGTAVLSDGTKFTGTYFLGNIYDGTITSSTGEVLYKGTFKNGQRDTGYGKETGIDRDGDKYNYEGGYKDMHYYGKGVLVFPEKDSKFEGEWTDGVSGDINGKGTFRWSNGDYYVGEYRDGRRSGKGTYYSANGDKYVGNWVNSNLHGEGTEISSAGEVLFKGTFSNGKRDTGYGKESGTNNDGTKWHYEGNYKNGKWNGKGTMIWDDERYNKGYKYVGNWVDGYRKGYGEMYYNGTGSYKGNWASGNYDGEGTRYFADHTYKRAIWKNHELVTVLETGTWQ